MKRRHGLKKRNRGQPTKYDPEYHPDMAFLWMSKYGFTDKELARAFGIARRTLYRWQKAYPEFCHTIARAKDIYDVRIEEAAKRRAMGFTYEEKTYEYQDGVPVLTKIVTKHIPPDTRTCIWWLCNRWPERWRDTHHIKAEDTTPGGGRSFAEMMDQIAQDIPGDLTDPGPEFTSVPKDKGR